MAKAIIKRALRKKEKKIHSFLRGDVEDQRKASRPKRKRTPLTMKEGRLRFLPLKVENAPHHEVNNADRDRQR
jgi:hypothetical protein